MAKNNNLTDFLTDLADGIRAAEGTTEDISPQDFRDRVENMVATVTSDADAAADNILSGKTAYVDGVKVTGTIPTKTSDNLTTNGATVSVPAGYYAKAASKSVKTATRADTTLTITADDTADTLKIDASNNQTDGYVTGANKTATTTVTLTASGATVTATETGGKKVSKSVASGSATTPATTVSVTPTISVDSSGKITASGSATKSVTPTVSAGYVSSGTAGTITASASNTKQLTTRAAKTVTPTTTNQTAVASGVYTTGAITVKGDSNLVASNIKSGTSIFGVAGTYTGNGVSLDSVSVVPESVKVIPDAPTAGMYLSYTLTDGTNTSYNFVIPTTDPIIPENIASGKTILGVTGTNMGAAGPVGKPGVEWVMLGIGASWDSKEISGCLFVGPYTYPNELTTTNVTNYYPVSHSLYDLPGGWYSNSSYQNMFVPKNSLITIWTTSTTALDYSSSTILTSRTGSGAGDFEKQELYSGGPIYYGYTYKVTGSGLI